ncbi:MAG: phage Gp37/Gp68 family protein, partial [Roseomonas sp.]|nr:phage Gp37/Gp68 family protein [Roseomonas sp.]
MGANTGIEWADHTFNPWIGCQAVSPACDNCYAETLVNGRMGGDFAVRRRTSPRNWRLPLKWDRDAAKAGKRARVFCASLADVFDNQADPAWRGDLWDLIWETRWLDWMLLTKRPQNIAKMLPTKVAGALDDWGEGWPNVWIGTT